MRIAPEVSFQVYAWSALFWACGSNWTRIKEAGFFVGVIVAQSGELDTKDRGSEIAPRQMQRPW